MLWNVWSCRNTDKYTCSHFTDGPICIIHFSRGSTAINTLSYCSDENVYCVSSTATSCSSHPALTIQPNAWHSLSMHMKLKCTLPPTLLWCSCQMIMFLIGLSVANVARLTMRGESSSNNLATIVRNESVGFSFTNMVVWVHLFFSFYLLQHVQELW